MVKPAKSGASNGDIHPKRQKRVYDVSLLFKFQTIINFPSLIFILRSASIQPVRNQLDFDVRVAQAIRVHWD